MCQLTCFDNAVEIDLVQDLYLKEIKGYKAPARTLADAEGSVKPWAVPKAPAAPAVEGAADLAAYKSEPVEVETQQEGGEDSATFSSNIDDWLVVENQMVDYPPPKH